MPPGEGEGMTRCGVCKKDAVFFTELYDNDNVFRRDGKAGLHVLYLCKEHHIQMLHQVKNALIRMQWKEVTQ